MRKITPEEYEQWLAENRPDFVILEEYKGASTAIKHRCSKGHEWMAYPGHIRRGTGCGKCANRGVEMYLEWLSENRPDLTMVGVYVNKDTPTLHRCSEGHEWMAYPGHIRKGHGCDTCHRESRGQLPAGYWTIERCIEDAQKYSTRKDWSRAAGAGYAVAKRNGWMDECTAHMEKLQRDPWTDEELIADAQKYSTRKEWARESPSAYSVSVRRGQKFHERACAHMSEPWSEVNRNNDAIYLWEWMENGVGTGIYKVGVTSWKLGDKRIRVCVGKNKLDGYRLIALCETSEGDATAFEKLLLDMGDAVALPDHIVDGRTEFKIYSESELALIKNLLGVKEAQAEAA